MNVNVDFKKVAEEITVISMDSIKELGKDVKADAQRFIDSSKDKLTHWLQLLANNELSMGEFYILVDSQISLLKLEGLKEEGVAKIKLDAFKTKLISILIHAVDIII